MLIRQATSRDAQAIARVQVRGWQIGYRGIVPDEYLSQMSVERLTNRWLGNLAEPSPMQHLVAENEDESVVGWAAFGPEQNDADSDGGELGALYVDPGQWGKGIGGALLQAAEQGLASAGYQQAILWTLAGNDRTRRFYEHRGWQFDGTEDRHASGVTVVRYARSLAAVDHRHPAE